MIDKSKTLIVIRKSEQPKPIKHSTTRKCYMCNEPCWVGPTPHGAQPPQTLCTFCYAAMTASARRKDGK